MTAWLKRLQAGLSVAVSPTFELATRSQIAKEHDDPRGELIRLMPADAVAGDAPNPEVQAQLAKWLNAHGSGRDTVYSMISVWVPPLPEAEPEEDRY